jgi:hypothetical protein
MNGAASHRPLSKRKFALALCLTLALAPAGSGALAATFLEHTATASARIEGKSQKKPGARKTAPLPPKSPAAPQPPQDPFQLPMRVVIARTGGKSCEPQCPEWISAQGLITPATPALFREVIRRAKGRKLPVLLSSPGGNVGAAAAIGRMIRKAGLDVAVGMTDFWACRPEDKSCVLPKEQKGVYIASSRLSYGFCASACPLILAGGVLRYASPMATLAVHELRTTLTREKVRYLETYRIVNGKKKLISRKVISRSRSSRETFGITATERKMLDSYLDEMGVSHDLIDEMAKAEFSSLNILPLSRARSLDLVNTEVVPTSFPSPCAVDPSASGCWPKSPVAGPGTAMIITLRRGIDCDPSCPEWIAAEGVITPDTPRQFQELLRSLGGMRLPVVLDSPGGDLDAALELGTMIREHKLSTVIAATGPVGCDPRDTACNETREPGLPYRSFLFSAGDCSRECLFILAGGIDRLVGWAQQKVYLPPLDELHTGQEGKSGRDIVAAYLDAMGIPRRLFDAADASGPAGGLYLLPLDLTGYLLGTTTVIPPWFTNPAICRKPSAAQNCVSRG